MAIPRSAIAAFVHSAPKRWIELTSIWHRWSLRRCDRVPPRDFIFPSASRSGIIINSYTYSLGTIFLVGLATIVAASEIGWQVGRAGRIAVLSYKSTRTFAAPLLASTVPATSGSIATP